MKLHGSQHSAGAAAGRPHGAGAVKGGKPKNSKPDSGASAAKPSQAQGFAKATVHSMLSYLIAGKSR